MKLLPDIATGSQSLTEGKVKNALQKGRLHKTVISYIYYAVITETTNQIYFLSCELVIFI
jgi:hypothetical protein